MEKNDGIIVDTLFVGATRPTTKCGVTWQAFVINIVISMEAFVWTHNLLWGLLFFPVHGIFYLICLRDPRAFELLMLWGPTKGVALLRNFSYWKAATYSPLSIHVGKKPSFLSRRKFKKLKG